MPVCYGWFVTSSADTLLGVIGKSTDASWVTPGWQTWTEKIFHRTDSMSSDLEIKSKSDTRETGLPRTHCCVELDSMIAIASCPGSTE